MKRYGDNDEPLLLTRRELALGSLTLVPGASLAATRWRSLMTGQTERVSLTSVDGVKVGHRTRSDRPTGCTVVLTEAGAVGGVAVRGAAPGTREIALLEPENTVSEVHAVVLTGGSAYGLATADGVMRTLRERGIGFAVGDGVVPIVPAAVLYDLGIGGNSYPDADDGAAACAAASTEPPAEGSVGAGAGATVGKMFGANRMKGGIGSAGFRFNDGTVVAALVAVNCRGDVREPRSGRIIAGARRPDGSGFVDVEAALLRGAAPQDDPAANTTIGVVATNRTLTKVECNRLASVAHDGLARAIVPAHTRFDGDTLFVLATGASGPPRTTGEHDAIEVAAAAAVGESILRAVRQATGLPGIPSASELADRGEGVAGTG
jgi:L-aminopeptidase/D-esterase-like protein